MGIMGMMAMHSIKAVKATNMGQHLELVIFPACTNYVYLLESVQVATDLWLLCLFQTYFHA